MQTVLEDFQKMLQEIQHVQYHKVILFSNIFPVSSNDKIFPISFSIFQINYL